MAKYTLTIKTNDIFAWICNNRRCNACPVFRYLKGEPTRICRDAFNRHEVEILEKVGIIKIAE